MLVLDSTEVPVHGPLVIQVRNCSPAVLLAHMFWGYFRSYNDSIRLPLIPLFWTSLRKNRWFGDLR